MKKPIIISAILMAAVTANAQDVLSTNLAWTVTQLTDLNSNAVVSYQCTFKTNGIQPIVWAQGNDSFITEFQVVQAEGTWADVTVNGKVIYQVSTDGLDGSLTIERNNGGVFITLVLVQAQGKNVHHLYLVSAVNPIN